MLRHVVMLSWNDDVDDDHVSAAGAALDTLPGKIDVIRSYVHGADLGISEGNFDYVVVADFDDADGYAVYRDHPDHQAVIQQYIAGHIEQRAAVQYAVI